MIALLLGLLAVIPDSTCVVCHSDLAQQYRESVHTAGGVGCTTCHGGTAGTLVENRAHRGLRKPSTDRMQVPRLCGDCHSNAEEMRPYGLPLDAYAYYLTSAHGKAWRRGRRDAAVCTDCHGVHGILPVNDPRSPVFRVHLAGTCASCHADTLRMNAVGLDPGIPDLYRKSVHAQAVASGNAHAPVCTDCHGSHGATPPGVRDVEQVCGRCHIREARAFDVSPHKKGFAQEDLAPCTSCHGEHQVEPLTVEGVQETCEGCHDEGDRGFDRARRLTVMLKDTQILLHEADSLLQEMVSRGYPVEDLRAGVEDARQAWMEALPLVHTLNPDTLELALGRVRGRAEDVESELYERAGRRREGLILLTVFWFYVLLTVGVIEARFRGEVGHRETSS